MEIYKKRNFKVDWILNNELAVGPAPIEDLDITKLKKMNIKSILSLCGENECPNIENIEKDFICKRVILPDHKCKTQITYEQLYSALSALKKIKSFGAVYVHCVAAKERSPLVCMAWLIQNHNLTPSQALFYVMQAHPGTNPLPEQLKVLELI